MTDQTPERLAHRATRIADRLQRLTRRARAVLTWERVWPVLAATLVVASVFVTVSWLGLWMHVPAWARIIGVLVFAVAFVASLVPLFRLERPGWAEALARIDRDTGAPHRPATALTDELAISRSDPGTRALWDAHRARILDAAERLTVAPPQPRLAARDPWALRFAALFALIGAGFLAGQERQIRLAAAFDWASPAAALAATRLDGWIDPPGYTQFPPVLLDLRRNDDGTPRQASVRVPTHATVVIRSSGREPLDVQTMGAIEVKEPAADAGAARANAPPAVQPPGPAAQEKQWSIVGDGMIVLRQGGRETTTITVSAIPDAPPTVELDGEPQANARGSLTLSYHMADDYGVVSGEARFASPTRSGKPLTGTKPPLVPPPTIPLVLPGGDNREGDAKTTSDLSAHPWAGARVDMTLAVRDEAGQEGTSAAAPVTLPQRSFTKPLARALVEQRRDLILDPGSRGRVQEALYALMIAPERFTPDAGTYLGLRTASSRLRAAKTDPDLLGVADYLWDMALQIEDGDLSDAEKALRQAQDALKQAMDRNATPEEIKRLTDELRQAMDRFLQEFAEKMLQNRDQTQQQARQNQNSRTVTPKDLQSMLDRLENLTRNGQMDEAQRLLDQLRDILENLQAARPNSQMDQMAEQMEQSLDDLDKMTRDQQDVRDKTFREGQRQREDARRGGKPQQGQQAQRQRGQQGQQGQKGQQAQRGQRGQQGEGQQGEGEQGEDGQEMGDGQGQGQGMQGLADRQQGLRQQLEQLKRKMREMGANPEQGLDDAEDAMRQAEGALGRGNDGDAVDAQGRALDGLRRGAQGLAQQMQEGEQGSEQAGEQPGPGRPGNRRAQGTERDDDPLGRPTRSDDLGDRSKFRRAGKGGSLEQRAREVMEELRRRLGDPTRPQDELDYLNRLLRPQ
jgi:uncharacterized protein (TIGR02302 family)